MIRVVHAFVLTAKVETTNDIYYRNFSGVESVGEVV